ncbi:glycosyltransferase [Parapedobacter koreensis]|uniref:Glycosyltransferase involved in cell wall bisynthesis n=1 Tax=Parapedobacter koreensis TaxID=332977 RepID=A0A1H7IJ22_9SPHI|nr:glycosyltransferase [Parapedobacter koreensis]SEK62334.1 Glycosyltransferase involved in cell wall bisynthesis [Parapedobacter koreensis]
MTNQQHFIIVGQQPWDTDIGSNCKNIALELSKHHRVLYVNSPLDRITLWRNRKDPHVQKRIAIIKGKADGLIRINENLWNLYPDCLVESINWIKFPKLYDRLNKRNNRLFANSIHSAIRSLGFGDVILFNDNEMFKAFYLKELLRPKLSIYYSRDYMLGVEYWRRQGERLEPLLIAKSDLCFSNSMYLRNYCNRYNARSYYVGQGCDIDFMAEVPANRSGDDFRGITSPIIGYVGSLDSNRLDIGIIAHIAEHFPDCAVVLVGPEDDAFLSSPLHQLKNVHFLGKKPVQDLPAYINAFDVCINPQLVNAITVGNYPRKIDEYLALGKPVVATATETMDIFKDFVYLTASKEGYIACIAKAFAEDNEATRTARKAFAASHTWENSVGEMYSRIAARLADA